MLHRFLAIAAWTALTLIIFVTVSPQEMRPVVTTDPNIERFAAFAVLGVLFGLAYPRRLVIDASFVVLAAGVLEAIQLVTRDRHGHLADAFVKAAGGAFGVAMALIILIVIDRRKAG
jgi:VanZ like protein